MQNLVNIDFKNLLNNYSDNIYIYIVSFCIVFSLVVFFFYLRAIHRYKKKYVEIQRIKEEEDSKRKDFISNMNHEIRTPINVISGMLDLVVKRNLDEQTIKYIQKIKRANLDIKNVIDSALDFNKFQGENVSIEKNQFNFINFIEELRSNFLSLAEAKGIKLQFDIDEQIPKLVIADEYILKSVCRKLLNNAIKFTNKGGVLFRVNLKESNDSVIKLDFQVIDTGIGMDVEKQKRLFKVFHQGDGSKTRTYGGLGVGLFLVQKMLNALNSSIRIQTEAGKGSKFSFSIIIEYIKDDLSDFEICKGKKIMFVDDDIINRQIGKTLLEDLKSEAVILSSGEEAVNRINNTFDLVILDIKMPGMDGTEVAEIIKEKGYNDIPIIALTGNVDKENLEEYKRVGINTCISKPIDLDVLKGVISDFFKTNGLNREFKMVEKSSLELDSEVRDFDPSKGLRLLNNDKVLYESILHKFRDDFYGVENKLENLMNMSDLKSAEIVVHSLKSVSASVGAIPLSNMCKKMEKTLKSGVKIDPKELSEKNNKVMLLVDAYLNGSGVNTESEVEEKTKASINKLKDLLLDLEKNLEINNPTNSKEILKEMESYLFDINIYSEISDMKKCVSDYDFSKASDIMNKINKKITENANG